MAKHVTDEGTIVDIMEQLHDTLRDHDVDFNDRQRIEDSFESYLRWKLETKDLSRYVREINTHYEVLSIGGNPNRDFEGEVVTEAYYAKELYDDSTVTNLKINKDDVERQISIATGSLQSYEGPYMRGEKEVTDEFIRTKALMLRSLNHLFILRQLFNDMDA